MSILALHPAVMLMFMNADVQLVHSTNTIRQHPARGGAAGDTVSAVKILQVTQ